jgi:hypothetical protein
MIQGRGQRPAARLAGRVPVDETALGVGGAAADAGQPQPGGVQHPVVPAALEQNRVVRRGLVEFGGGGQAAFREAQFVPVGGAPDPLPGWGQRGALPDQPNQPRYVGGPGDGHAEDVLGRQHQVVMRVDEGGQHHESRVIDHDRPGAAPGGEQVTAVVRPGRRGDPAVADSEHRHRGSLRGPCVDRARVDDEIGGHAAHGHSV